MKRLRLSMMLLTLVPVGAEAFAQSTPVLSLPQPEATLRQGFTDIVGMRELSDGRLIVVDQIERSVSVISADLTTARVIGRNGSGPGEYLLPSSLLALGGDTSLVRDNPNSRFLLISPDGTVGDVRDLQGRPPRTKRLSSTDARASASDLRGNFYSQTQATATDSEGRLVVIDSAAILRWTTTSTDRDTVAFVPVRHLAGTQAASGMVVRLGGEPIALRAVPQWTVSIDGWVAIVNEDPYRVDLVSPDGIWRRGPPIEYEPLRVSEGHKQQWCVESERPSPVLRGTRGGTSTITNVRRECSPPSEWPDFLPPFLSGAVHFAADGDLWIERTVPAGQPPVFDVLDRTASVTHQVRLPAGRRLLGFGRDALYLVLRDDVDLEYVERYPVTAGMRRQ